MKWLKQLSQVIDYIESNLTGVISYDEAAKIACCSTYYFQRMFTHITGIPLVNEAIYETIMNLIVLSIFFTSTALFPMDGISGGLKIAVMINPFTHIINSLRSLILGTSVDWQNLLLVAALFICLCLGSFALAHWRLKKETTN